MTVNFHTSVTATTAELSGLICKTKIKFMAHHKLHRNQNLNLGQELSFAVIKKIKHRSILKRFNDQTKRETEY